MDAMEILGGLLKRQTGGSGKGGNILIDILNQVTQAAPERQTESAPGSNEPNDTGRAARELEDLLNVATGRGAPRGAEQPRAQQPRQASPAAPQRPAAQQKPAAPQAAQKSRPSPAPRASEPGWPGDSDPNWQNEQATVLVRAMLNAAKADGEISPDEQRSILKEFDSSTPEALRFLREEIARPLDVREFAWSVPIGMEQQVYAMSLLAINVDARAETQYLQELAHALRLPQQMCEQLQQRYSGQARAVAAAR
jgi:uncharacterized membrane protein YebE (DUF533 family)